MKIFCSIYLIDRFRKKKLIPNKYKSIHNCFIQINQINARYTCIKILCPKQIRIEALKRFLRDTFMLCNMVAMLSQIITFTNTATNLSYS